MDNFKLAEIIKDMFDEEACEYYRIGLNFVELDKCDGSLGMSITQGGKTKRFLIEIKEV